MVSVNTSGYPYVVFYNVKWANLLIIKILVFFLKVPVSTSLSIG